MKLHQEIEKLLFSHLGGPAVEVDSNGVVKSFNDEASVLFKGLGPDKNFFEIVDTNDALILNKLFTESKQLDSIVKGEIEIAAAGKRDVYEVIFTPTKIEGNVSFIISFRNILDDTNKHTTVSKFSIDIAELEKVTDDPKILSVINKVKSSFPFTFIEKSKIQREINSLDNFFWIKEPDGKYIITNEKLALSLGVKTNQLENRLEKDFLPKHYHQLYKTVDAYICETSNAVTVEGLIFPANAGEGLKVVEFPITDFDNKIIAIICFSVSGIKKEESAPLSSLSVISAFHAIDSAALFIDTRRFIRAHSSMFNRLFNLDENVDLKGRSLDEIFTKEFSDTVNEIIRNSNSPNIVNINYRFDTGDENKNNYELEVSKIFTDIDKLSGLLITFIEKDESQSLNELKVTMYDLIMRTSPEAVFIYDIENLRFLEVNDAALKLYGYKRDAFLNMDLTDLYAPEDIQTLIESSESKNSTGAFTGPWRHKRSDGSSILVELSKTSMEYKGRKTHFNIVHDITEKIENNKKLQLFQAAFEYSSDLIINTDSDGFITYVNDAAVKFTGYTKMDLEKRPFLSLLGDKDRARVNKSIFHSGLKNNQKLEVKMKKPNGVLADTTLIATPIVNYLGEIESFNLLIKPAQETKSSHAPEIASKSAGSQADPQFLSNVFHELLTPINVIIGFVQEITESITNPTEEQKEAADIIQENQKLLLQIMDNAVEYSSLEQKSVKLKIENVGFASLIDELRENTKKISESSEVELLYGKISSSLAFKADKQKFSSLITLFLKFALQVTKEKAIYLSAYPYEDGTFAVTIKDSRSSISDILLNGMNDIIASDENQIRRNYGFSRFTVRLAQKLLQILSGTKKVITKDNQPAEFAFIFPLEQILTPDAVADMKGEKPVQAYAGTVEEKHQEVLIQEEMKPEPVIKPERKPAQKTVEGPKRVPVMNTSSGFDQTQLSCLYLEDQVDSQILFKVQMKDLKNIDFATSFEKAIPLLKNKHYDFIVMDINLQGEYNGLDALRIIQKMPGYKDIPIIAATAYVLPGDKENFIAAGFREFVSKPLLRDKLLDALKNIFS